MPTYLSPGVYVEEVDSGSRPIEGVGTAVAAFVGIASEGPLNTPTLVTNWSQFTQTFGEFLEDSYLAHAVYGYFQNGGGNCYIVRIGADGGKADGKKSAPGPLQAMLGGYRVRAVEAGRSGSGSGSAKPKTISVEVSDPSGESPPENSFKLVVRRDNRVVEEHDGLSTAPGEQNAVTVVNAKSKLINLEEVQAGAALERPPNGTVTLRSDDGSLVTLRPDDYVGSSADRTGFGGLEAVDEITMVCVPDLWAAYLRGRIDMTGVKAIQLGMIAHCELMGDRIAVLDPPPNLNAQKIKEWRSDTAGYDSKYACLYYPWISVFDPARGREIFVPPSGHIAGIWGRNDDTRGVHKAPANEVVRGALSLEMQLTKQEHDLLNPIGINCLRGFPNRGLRVWGARTLSSDPAWRYLNVRRLFNYLEESILNGTQWVVFEPNDPALWAKITRTIASFLVMEWRKGALFGLTPDEAFYVKCDAETNPAEGIDLGQVVCEIGVAPVKPAEFVIFRLSQFSGGTSLVAE
jgi:phage tail sheath protein FI